MSFISYSHHRNPSVCDVNGLKIVHQRRVQISSQHGDTQARVLVHSWNLKEKLVNSKKGDSQEKAIREVSPPYLPMLQLALSSAPYYWALWLWPYTPGWLLGRFPHPHALYITYHLLILPSSTYMKTLSLCPVLRHREMFPNVFHVPLRLTLHKLASVLLGSELPGDRIQPGSLRS